MININKKPLYILNTAVFLQQQRYLLPVSFLFYIYNGLTLSDFIFFQGIFYFVCLIAEIPAGYIGDIFKRKNILIFSYILFLLRIVLWIFYRGYWAVLIGEVFYGLSKAFYRGVSDGYIYDYLKSENIPESMLKKYGKYNFFMSFGCAISSILGVFLYKHFGFSILLILELIIHSTAIALLFFLRQIPHNSIKKLIFKNHIKIICTTIIKTLKNKNINSQIFYNSILFGITSLLVWNFQPIMKSAALPVAFFGVIYFINHTTRALASLFAQKTIEKISYNTLGVAIWFLYFASFFIIIINKNYINSLLCFISLVVICFIIAVGIIYNIATTSLIHKYADSKIRATMSSVNNMFAGFFSGLFLMIYKHLIENISVSKAFLIFAICFIFVFCIPYSKRTKA